jgi:hypothetical protein
MEEYISITVKQYKYFLKRDAKLSALEQAGADKWYGWNNAIAELYGESEK